MSDPSHPVLDIAPALARFIDDASVQNEDILTLLTELHCAVKTLAARLPVSAGGGISVSSQSVAARHTAYVEMLGRVRHAVRQTVPVGAVIAVVNKGDPDLLNFEGRRGWHFPQDAKGQYTGFHPPDSATVITHLEELRVLGAEYLLIPQTALWWLDHYGEFSRYIEERYAVVLRQPDTCAIVRLSSGSGGHSPSTKRERSHDQIAQFRAVVNSILPDDVHLLVVSRGDEAMLRLDRRKTRHFPCTDDGNYVGYHPANSADAIARLEEQILLGAEYLAIPVTSFWWLEYYHDFARHLETCHRLIARQKHVAFIYELTQPADCS